MLTDFRHRFLPGDAGAPVLLLLHGTGGTEDDLLGLGDSLAPGWARLSPRGKVRENGMPRFFRRLAEGVFDEEDLVRRTHELADFVGAARAEYGLGERPVVALGYSNGANIAASLLLLRPEVLAGAVLLRAMVPLEPAALPDAAGVAVLIAAGRRDAMIPAAGTERLAAMLRQAGAAVELRWTEAGHELHAPELAGAGEWLRERFSGAGAGGAAAGAELREGTGPRGLQLHGIHHLTAVTANAAGNHDFYTRALGLRLVKKTVNQDDVSAYHLFYADGVGSPGSDLTFFDWPAARERRGTRSIVRTGLRVAGAGTLEWWRSRFAALGVTPGEIGERDGRATLDAEDPEGQRFCLVDDGGAGAAHPWAGSPVPAERQIRGLGPITISVPRLAATDRTLREVLNFRPAREYADAAGAVVRVYEMGAGGPAAELHVVEEPGAAPARAGAGGVHHVAFRTTRAEYDAWAERLARLGVASSGPVDRFYFRSLYFREPSGILFELATDEPGFTADEPLESLGRRLSLPPFLEPRRAEIEAGLRPIADVADN